MSLEVKEEYSGHDQYPTSKHRYPSWGETKHCGTRQKRAEVQV
jgi:hypothetical protein